MGFPTSHLCEHTHTPSCADTTHRPMTLLGAVLRRGSKEGRGTGFNEGARTLCLQLRNSDTTWKLSKPWNVPQVSSRVLILYCSAHGSPRRIGPSVPNLAPGLSYVTGGKNEKPLSSQRSQACAQRETPLGSVQPSRGSHEDVTYPRIQRAQAPETNSASFWTPSFLCDFSVSQFPYLLNGSYNPVKVSEETEVIRTCTLSTY